MDPVRMDAPAGVAASPMVGANCHRGEQTYAMGRLKLGLMYANGSGGGKVS
jgi:hypothetical protein